MLFVFWISVTTMIIHHLLKREEELGKFCGKLKKNKVVVKPKKRKY